MAHCLRAGSPTRRCQRVGVLSRGKATVHDSYLSAEGFRAAAGGAINRIPPSLKIESSAPARPPPFDYAPFVCAQGRQDKLGPTAVRKMNHQRVCLARLTSGVATVSAFLASLRPRGPTVRLAVGFSVEFTNPRLDLGNRSLAVAARIGTANFTASPTASRGVAGQVAVATRYPLSTTGEL